MNEINTQKKKGLFWWPNYLIALSIVMLLMIVLMVFLSLKFAVPFQAPDVVPLPDEGENVPGPEWVFLLFWQGFWYLTGLLKKYLVWMPLIPIFMLVFFIFLPVMHKVPFDRIPGLKNIIEKARAMKPGVKRSFIYALPTLIFATLIMGSVLKTGHQAKILGCDSCHNPAMGARMAIPPANVAKYYATERAMQIGVGKYRAGKSGGVDDAGNMTYSGSSETQGYKDANWQMRHMYEPTFTW